MHYDDAHIYDLPGEDFGNGYRRVTITLKEGDTATAPGTTKKVLTGAGVYVYSIDPHTGLSTRSTPPGMQVIPIARSYSNDN